MSKKPKHHHPKIVSPLSTYRGPYVAFGLAGGVRCGTCDTHGCVSHHDEEGESAAVESSESSGSSSSGGSTGGTSPGGTSGGSAGGAPGV